jgi:hypothetical protein
MAFASDQTFNPGSLSPLSRKMLELREVVFAEWEQRVRASVVGAAHVPHSILIDTLPSLYDNLAEALTPGYSRTRRSHTVVRTRARRRTCARHAYESQAVTREYQTIRTTIIDVPA